MVTADRALCASQIGVDFGVAVAGAGTSHRSAPRGVRSTVIGCMPQPKRAPKLLTLVAISCAMAVAGCASNSMPSEHPAEPIQAAPPPQIRPEPRIRRPARALLVPPSVPDCEFKRDDLKTMDPEQWARLKLDYERQCYRRAEKVARDRLRLLQASSLQASSKCEIEPARVSMVR